MRKSNLPRLLICLVTLTFITAGLTFAGPESKISMPLTKDSSSSDPSLRWAAADPAHREPMKKLILGIKAISPLVTDVRPAYEMDQQRKDHQIQWYPTVYLRRGTSPDQEREIVRKVADFVVQFQNGVRVTDVQGGPIANFEGEIGKNKQNIWTPKIGSVFYRHNIVNVDDDTSDSVKQVLKSIDVMLGYTTGPTSCCDDGEVIGEIKNAKVVFNAQGQGMKAAQIQNPALNLPKDPNQNLSNIPIMPEMADSGQVVSAAPEAGSVTDDQAASMANFTAKHKNLEPTVKAALLKLSPQITDVITAAVIDATKTGHEISWRPVLVLKAGTPPQTQRELLLKAAEWVVHFQNGVQMDGVMGGEIAKLEGPSDSHGNMSWTPDYAYAAYRVDSEQEGVAKVYLDRYSVDEKGKKDGTCCTSDDQSVGEVRGGQFKRK